MHFFWQCLSCSSPFAYAYLMGRKCAARSPEMWSSARRARNELAQQQRQDYNVYANVNVVEETVRSGARSILLTENNTAVVTDFGLSKAFEGESSLAEASRISMSRVVETSGFCCPNYSQTRQFSARSPTRCATRSRTRPRTAW